MRYSDAMDANRKARERAERLRLIREKLHKIRSQRQFAAQLNVPYNTYNNWERGSPIPESWVERLKRITPGITGDWLFWGDESRLDVETLRKIKDKNG